MAVDMKKNKNFLTLDDISTEEIEYLLQLSAQLKAAKRARSEKRYLEGKQIALIFEKDSTRTRSAFEVAAYDQGAHVTYLGPNGSHIGYKESIKDTARVLGRMYDGIEYRGFGQHIVEDLAEYSGVPVWNGLTDEAHPTQVLADLLTIQEHVQKPLNEVSLCYLGALHYNMADSLMIGAAKMGLDMRLAGPRTAWPTTPRLELAQSFARQSGGRITLTDDVATAVQGCDILYTDVWVSMGEPVELWGERIQEMLPYQVNNRLMSLTLNPDIKFMHCLPAFHNTETKVGKQLYEKYGIAELEVTDEVFESSASIVFDQAENRLHTIKAIMVSSLGDL